MDKAARGTGERAAVRGAPSLRRRTGRGPSAGSARSSAAPEQSGLREGSQAAASAPWLASNAVETDGLPGGALRAQVTHCPCSAERAGLRDFSSVLCWLQAAGEFALTWRRPLLTASSKTAEQAAWLCGPCPGRGSRTWVWRGRPQPRAGSPLPSLLLPRGLRSPECLLDGILQHCKPHESPSWSHILNFSDLGDFRDVSGSPVGLSDLQRGLWCSLDCGPGPSETGEGVARGVCEPSVNVFEVRSRRSR